MPFLIAVLLAPLSVLGHPATDSSSAYRETLHQVFREIKQDQTPNDSLLLASFPDSEEEYGVLYSYTHPDSSEALHQAYRQRLALIHKRLGRGRKLFVREYLLLSRFIDGEEAEVYFLDDLPAYMARQKETFCAVYTDLNRNGYELRRLRDSFTVCSGVNRRYVGVGQIGNRMNRVHR